MKRRLIVILPLLMIAFFLLNLFQQKSIAQEVYIPKNEVIPIESEGFYFTDLSQSKLFTGFFRSYYDTGDLKLEMFIKDGKPDGPYVVYFQNARINEVRSYHNGEFNGIWRSYNENGMLISQAEYLAGKKHGMWMIWDDNGIRRYEMQYTKGKKSGIWYMWDEKGKLISEKKY